MKEIRYFYVPDAANQTQLTEEEAKHAVRVLRLEAGDGMFLVDGKGGLFEAEVTVASTKHCMYRIVRTLEREKEWRGHITLAIAPTKMMDRIEWMAEKCTEIGFDEIDFLDCKFSERKSLRTDRIERIVVAAMKQSHKAEKPQVGELTRFEEFVKTPRTGRKFIAHCYEEVEREDLYTLLHSTDCASGEPLTDDVTILVGPEGDFSIDEVRMAVEHGYQSVSLGKCRLRTETAGLSAVMMANLTMRR